MFASFYVLINVVCHQKLGTKQRKTQKNTPTIEEYCTNKSEKEKYSFLLTKTNPLHQETELLRSSHKLFNSHQYTTQATKMNTFFISTLIAIAMMICCTATTEAMPTSLRGGRQSASSSIQEKEEEATDEDLNDDDDDLQAQRKEEEAILSCDEQPNTTPFRLELGIDGYGHETTWVLTMHTNDENEPNRIIGEVDDEETYEHNSEYVEYLCISNDATFTFTIFDDRGDGLRVDEGAYYRGILGSTDDEDNATVFTMPDGEWDDLSHTFTTTTTTEQITI